AAEVVLRDDGDQDGGAVLHEHDAEVDHVQIARRLGREALEERGVPPALRLERERAHAGHAAERALGHRQYGAEEHEDDDDPDQRQHREAPVRVVRDGPSASVMGMRTPWERWSPQCGALPSVVGQSVARPGGKSGAPAGASRWLPAARESGAAVAAVDRTRTGREDAPAGNGPGPGRYPAAPTAGA